MSVKLERARERELRSSGAVCGFGVVYCGNICQYTSANLHHCPAWSMGEDRNKAFITQLIESP